MSSDPQPDAGEAEVRAGDRAALASLLAKQEDVLRRWVERRLDQRLQGRVAASDIVQDVYLAAEQRLEHFGTLAEMPFHVWVRLLAGQRLIEIHRRYFGTEARDAKREVHLGGATTSAGLAEQLVGNITTASQVAVRHEALDLVTDAIDAMDPLDREVIVLRHFEELSNVEVAQRLGISKDAASKRYIRALGRLKTILEQVPGLLDDLSPETQP